MKKFLLILVGIILFAIVAFSGAINAFYDTPVSLTTPVANAEEIEGEGEGMLEEVVEPEVEEPIDTEEVADEEPATEETELLGDKLLAFVGLKGIVDEIGLDIAKKIGLGIVTVGSFFEAIIILNIFKKKQDKAPKAMRGPKPPKHKRFRKHTREIPIEGYREPSHKEGIRF